jgi:PAS domain S-box-containing protein
MQTKMKAKEDKTADVFAENETLRQQLAEAQEILRAIQHREVDALIVSTPQGEQVYTITGAEKHYRILIEEMKEGAVMLSEDNSMVYCNSGFAKIVKKPLDQLIGKSINDLLNPTHLAVFGELLALGRRGEGVKEKEIGFKASDGTVVPTHVSVNASMKDEIRTTFLVIVDLTQHMQEEVKDYTSNLEREITQRKKAEAALKKAQAKLEEYAKELEDLVEERTKQLRDSERMATIGTTAGMVGHDIRNPLQAITGEVYLAKIELSSIPESDEKTNVLEGIHEIEKNIDYINKIVQDLQDFARPLDPRAEEIDLKLIIDELLQKTGLPAEIKVNVKIESDTMKVLADSTFINRIIYNLVNNAVQAMPKGGKLTIQAHKDKKSNDAIIIVEDTGFGIPEAVKNKLFTPMFTTKPKGQGFGLAVVKRMTEALGGTVTFESEVGKGTKFIVRFPPPKELNGKWTYSKLFH